jgi:hypothetical protein
VIKDTHLNTGGRHIFESKARAFVLLFPFLEKAKLLFQALRHTRLRSIYCNKLFPQHRRSL